MITRIGTALFVVLLAPSSPAFAKSDGAVRLQPGLCGGEVSGTVTQSAKRLPTGLKLIGQCRVVGEGAERSYMILWSLVDAAPALRPSRLNGAPFGTSVVPAKCNGDACATQQLPDIDIPIHLRAPLPKLWDGDSM